MRWPWSKPVPAAVTERRNYTGSLIAALEGGASGPSTRAPLKTAALEAAAGLYARCLAAAIVRADDDIARAVTPACLALIARNLIRRGEDCHLIEVRRGRLRLLPVGFWYVHGDSPDPDSWHYRATAYGPSGSRHEMRSAASVLHCRYSVDSARPWLGVPPWSWAGDTGAGIAGLDKMLADKAAAPHGTLLGLPESPEVDAEGEVRPMDAFRADLGKASGKTLIMEYTGQQGQDAPGGGRGSRYEQIGFGFPAELIDALRTATGHAILAACGVPPGLFTATGDGSAQREAFRRFLHSGLRAVARLIEQELSDKLDTEIRLDLSEIHAADIAGRARAFASLVKAELTPQDAALNTGILINQEVQ